jgi:hypothetical protein
MEGFSLFWEPPKKEIETPIQKAVKDKTLWIGLGVVIAGVYFLSRIK